MTQGNRAAFRRVLRRVADTPSSESCIISQPASSWGRLVGGHVFGESRGGWGPAGNDARRCMMRACVPRQVFGKKCCHQLRIRIYDSCLPVDVAFVTQPPYHSAIGVSYAGIRRDARSSSSCKALSNLAPQYGRSLSANFPFPF